MDFSAMEQVVFAHYVAEAALDFTMVPRFWPYGELVLIIEDKVQFASLPFGFKAKPACAKVARELLDLLLERGGFSTVQNSLGVMHQFQPKAYRRCIEELRETDRLVQQAKDAGPDFWKAAFAEAAG